MDGRAGLARSVRTNASVKDRTECRRPLRSAEYDMGNDMRACHQASSDIDPLADFLNLTLSKSPTFDCS